MIACYIHGKHQGERRGGGNRQPYNEPWGRYVLFRGIRMAKEES